MNGFIGSSLDLTIISSYTLKITVTIAHVTWHTKSFNSSSGHTAVPLELRNSSEVNSQPRVLSYPLGTDHAQNTQFYCCVAQTTQKTSHMKTTSISPVHWLADCCLSTRHKHSFYCCETLSEKVFIAPLPGSTRYNKLSFYSTVLFHKVRPHYKILDSSKDILCITQSKKITFSLPFIFPGYKFLWLSHLPDAYYMLEFWAPSNIKHHF
jgi:hypothetical protein